MKTYKTLYPLTLFVCTVDELNKLTKRFNGHDTIEELRASVNPKVIKIDASSYHGFTGLVQEKITGKYGILVCMEDEDVSINTIAHESVHVADAMFDYSGAVSQGFDDSNEPYAYLIGWVAGCISDYLIEIKRNKERDEEIKK